MKSYYKNLWKIYLSISVTTAVVFMILDVVDHIFDSMSAVGFFFMLPPFCAILSIVKPNAFLQISWLRTLPIKKRQLLVLVVSDFFAPWIMLAIASFLGFTFLITLSIAEYWVQNRSFALINWHNLTEKIAFILKDYSFDRFAYFTDLSSLIRIFLYSVIASVGVLLVPAKHENFPAQKMGFKSYLVLPIFSLIAAFLLIFIPILGMVCFFGYVLMLISYHSVRTFLPARHQRNYARMYSGLVFASVIAIPVLHVEIWTPEGLRTVERIRYYGAIHRDVPFEQALTLMSEPSMSNGDRAELSNALNRSPEFRDRVNPDQLARWSRLAPTLDAYLSGLGLFTKNYWEKDSLLQLEEDLKQRCNIQEQFLGRHLISFACLLDNPFPSLITLGVRRSVDVSELLTEKHPLLAAILISAAVDDSPGLTWHQDISRLAHSEYAVLSGRANLWLKRASLNPSGIWRCQSQRAAQDSICVQNEFSRSEGIVFQSHKPGDNGGDIKIKIIQ